MAATKNAPAPRPAAAAPAEKPTDFLALLERSRGEIAKLMPTERAADRVMRIARTAFQMNADIRRCAPGSILAAVMKACELNLEPGGALRHAWLVPYGPECTFQVSYFGMLELARRSGAFRAIEARVVRPGDVFQVAYDPEPVFRHVPDLDAAAVADDGQILHAYSYARLANGALVLEVMSRAEIERVRQAAKCGPVWQKHWGEMAKKGLALDTPIPTPSGWSTMGDLQTGDHVFDGNGEPTRVTAVSEVKCIPCYRLTLSNGESLICDHEHRWPASLGKQGARTRSHQGWGVYEIGELFAAKQRGEIVGIPVSGSLRLPEADLPVEPWLLGYWLGNGHSFSARVTCRDDDLAEVVEQIGRTGYRVGSTRPDPRSRAVDVGVCGGMIGAIRSLQLCRNKHVPSAYLRADQGARLALLSGLMDSDGCIDGARGRAIFANTNLRLADAVAELATSIGEVVHRSARICRGYGKSVLTHFVAWQPQREPVTLTRKRERFRPRKLAPYRSIASIEPCPAVETRCIAVESSTQTYLCGRSMVVTHNTVIKRLLKRQPCSVELAEAIEHDNQEYDLGDVTPRQGVPAGRGAAGLAGRLGAPPAPEPEPEFAAGEGVARPVYSEDDDAQALAEAEALDRAEGT